MNIEQAIEILHSLVTTSLLLVAPILLSALVVGLIVSLLQAVTSIQEQTLSFIPKLVALSFAILISAPWMARTLMQFTSSCFSRLPDMVR